MTVTKYSPADSGVVGHATRWQRYAHGAFLGLSGYNEVQQEVIAMSL